MKPKHFLLVLLSLMLLVVTGCGPEPSSADESGGKTELHVAAAASLTEVMKELREDYEKLHPDVKLVFNFGSSGALQQAIENGGDADVFVSAAQKQMDVLDASGNLLADTRKDLLKNEIVLVVPGEADRGLNSFEDLADREFRHIALGDPRGVPAGRYAVEVLTKRGVYDAIKEKAVYGSDVRQVLSWVASGEADCGVVYATDAAITKDVAVVARADETDHEPIIYPAAVIKNARHVGEAKEFLAYMGTDQARAVFARYGFEPLK